MAVYDGPRHSPPASRASAPTHLKVASRSAPTGTPRLQTDTEISEHLEPALALYMIIAWRIQSIVMLGRAYPDLPCDVVFDDLEWRTAFVIRHHRPPTAPPRLADMITIIASFGGYLARKSIRLPAPRPSGSDYSVCGILLSREQPSIKSTEFVWNDVALSASQAMRSVPDVYEQRLSSACRPGAPDKCRRHPTQQG